MRDFTVIYAIASLGGLAIGYSLAVALSTRHRRHRVMKRIHCIMGNHEPGPVREVVGGRRQQRCDWCDKLVHEYQVTKDQLNRESIRRIF